MNNVITIEFFDKKGFPPGKWLSEPDLCFWYYGEVPCLALRDMSMGIWKGFVGIMEGHPFFEKPMNVIISMPQALELFRTAYGGVSAAGRLPAKYQNFAKSCWWISIETSGGGDLMPLLKLNDDPEIAKMLANQTYKDLHFIRRETNKLAKFILTLK